MFTSTWCVPCTRIGTRFKGFAEEFENIKMVKVEIDENSETTEAYGISAMPTFAFFKNKVEKVQRLFGANENKLQKRLQNLAS